MLFLLLELYLRSHLIGDSSQVPDILDNAFVIVEYGNGCRAMLDLCMFAEGSRNEQELSVTGDAGKVIGSL